MNQKSFSDQIIDFSKTEDQCPTHIYAKNVKIKPGAQTVANERKASNKITTTKVVDYNWQERYTLGHLISYHTHTKLIAYVLSISNSYMIRILNDENSSRCLIKNFKGEIVDIAFCKSKIPYIASIDIYGFVKINKITVTDDILESQLILCVEPSLTETMKSNMVTYNRVMWCWHSDVSDSVNNVNPSVPNEVLDENDEGLDENDEATVANISLLLGIVCGNSFDVIQLDTMEIELQTESTNGKKYNPNITRERLCEILKSFQDQYSESGQLTELFLPYLYYEAPGTDNKITSFAMSSDAAAFAAGLKDGSVRFFTLDGAAKNGLKEEYSWKPFEGESVWSLLFLDDCRPGSKLESYWCHVVVGSQFNRQLKLFRCDKWDCVQTMVFDASDSLISAHIDESATFLLASDVRRKVLYVIEIGSIDEGSTRLFKSVQEFVLSDPLLSFDINTVSTMPTSEGYQQIVIKLFTITNNAFQKMRVSYHIWGHRMTEVLPVTTNGDISESVSEVNGYELSKSMITRVSSIAQSSPTTSNNFQDPAIIATQLPLPSNSNQNTIESTDNVPVTLQHLFAAAAAAVKTNSNEMLGTTNAPKLSSGDSGDESGDEASLNYDDGERKCELDEEIDFPIPPCDVIPPPAPSGGWLDENRIMMLHHLVKKQQDCIEELTNQVGELRKEITDMSTAIDRKVERDQRNVVQAVTESVRDSVEAVANRAAYHTGTKLNEELRNQLANIVVPALRDSVTHSLQEERFITRVAEQTGEISQRSVRKACSEVVAHDMTPALGRCIDKLTEDVGAVLSDGVTNILKSMELTSKKILDKVEDKVMSQSKRDMGIIDTHFKNLNIDLAEWKSNMIGTINQQALTQTRIIDSVRSVKDNLKQYQQNLQQSRISPIIDMQDNSHITRGHSMASLVSTPGAVQSTSKYSTPVADATVNSELNITRFLAPPDPVAAMTEALTLTNLPILLQTCSRIKPRMLLSGSPNKPSPLPINSICALLQQISRDFTDQFDLKFDFMLEAILSLSVQESGQQDICLRLLKGVTRRLNVHLDQHERVPANRDRIQVLLRLITSKIETIQDS